MGKRKQTEKMRRDQLNDEYLNLIEKQRLYFKTVKDFQEVIVLFKIIITCFRCFTVVCCHLVNDSVIAGLGLWLLEYLDKQSNANS